MRIYNLFGCLLAALLFGFSSSVSADVLPGAAESGAITWQKYGFGAVRVAYSKQVPEDVPVVVVRRHKTYWVKPVHGQGRIRITVPVEFYLSSWDVKALERELERLGIKVKPKPVPRPKPVVSG